MHEDNNSDLRASLSYTSLKLDIDTCIAISIIVTFSHTYQPKAGQISEKAGFLV